MDMKYKQDRGFWAGIGSVAFGLYPTPRELLKRRRRSPVDDRQELAQDLERIGGDMWRVVDQNNPTARP